MKHLHYLCLLGYLALPFLASAQDTTAVFEGTIRYLNTHSWTKKLEGMKHISKQQRERNAYLYGNDEWKAYTRLYVNSQGSRYEESDEKTAEDGSTYAWRKETFQVKRNFNNQTMYDILTISGKVYIVEDSIRYQAWAIKNDLKEVAGHLCMNAVWQDTLKEQTIEVWFALDLPVSTGPERLGGLPGIILEVNVNNGALHIIADKIEPRKLSTELNLPQKKYKGKKVNETAYLVAVREYIAESRKQGESWWGIRY
jgi:GLPGLI family protein